MACEVCDHCDASIHPGQEVLCQGCSYHEKCRKCYVCSETNLRGAEVFKGVIFCSSCSKRIFEGCYSARRSKNKSRRKTRPIKTRARQENVIEIARRHMNESRSESDYGSFSKSLKTIPVEEIYTKDDNMKKNSVEMGTTTEVTQELLKQMNYPILDTEEHEAALPAKPIKKRKKEKHRHRKKTCSDLRIAELGASTEIAHMALRQRSAVPIIIKSESHIKPNDFKSLSLLQQNSDSRMMSDSDYSSKNIQHIHWLDRRLGSILKIPYKSFKRNILDRSSLISIAMNNAENKGCLLKKFKELFYEEITRHQKRGLKKLFSTINRKKTPYKLGWLQVKTKPPRDLRCKHFKKSHSYRCMRAQVMRLAGPTSSELAVYRSKMKKVLPKKIMKRVLKCGYIPDADNVYSITHCLPPHYFIHAPHRRGVDASHRNYEAMLKMQAGIFSKPRITPVVR